MTVRFQIAGADFLVATEADFCFHSAVGAVAIFTAFFEGSVQNFPQEAFPAAAMGGVAGETSGNICREGRVFCFNCRLIMAGGTDFGAVGSE
jgi:hypothetical protein